MATKHYRLIDDRDESEPMGGLLTEDNAYIAMYPVVVKGEKQIADLAVGESTFCEYRLSGQRGVYRVLRVD